MNRTGRSSEIDEAESTYSKAAKAELGKKFDTAFGLYIKSAEIFLHLSRGADATERDKTKWKGRAAQALERAEKIKAATRKSTEQASGSNDALPAATLTPVGIDHFSHRQQSYVLQRAGTINGRVFPLWEEAPPSTSRQESKDSDWQPALSPEQAEAGTVWRSPDAANYADPSTWLIRAEDIVQHVVTDCSVCASLSVCLEHARRFQSQIARDGVRYDASSSRCDVKILFNGSSRRSGLAVIDDKLPHHPTTGTLMCMTCRDGTTARVVAWPSHIEKAYMKLMGGYDFPGSNSCIDLHAIGGWIPEQLDIKSSNFERERTWGRIYEGFNRGQCLLTLGTGPQPNIRWGSARLLSSHSYAVIDVHQDEKERVLTVLDSWVPATVAPADSSDDVSRTLRIPWSDVLAIFEGIYLSWDPQLWPNTLTFHGMWTRPENSPGSMHETKARFNLMSSASEETEVWVLLSRHVRNTQRRSNFIALKVETDDEQALQPLGPSHVIDNQGQYTNSTHVLVKCRISQNQPSGIMTMLSSFDGPCKNPGFTLTIYFSSDVDIAWETSVVTPPFTSQLECNWTHKTAGGNPEYPTFMLNPQYLLKIHGQPRTKANVSATLQTVKDLPVNIIALWSQGERIFDLSHKDVVATSGSYRYGVARISAQLSPGDYNLIVSAFEPQKTGPYALTVDSSCRFELTRIPQEGAGMYSKVIRGAWDAETAVGGPSFKRYLQNPIYEILCPSAAQIKLRLQLIRPGASAPLNVTVIPATASISTQTNTLATSGAYDDAISGVVTPEISVDRGKYWIVPSTYSSGVEAPFQLILYSSVAVTMVLKGS